MIFAFVCTCSYLVIAISDIPVISIIACTVCGISVSVMWPGVFSMAAEHFKNSGASLFSLLAMFGDFGCATGPWILGIVSDLSVNNGIADRYAATLGLSGGKAGMQLGFLVTSAIPFIMFLVLLFSFLRRRRSL